MKRYLSADGKVGACIHWPDVILRSSASVEL
jgi:hypothetical protein